MHTPHSPAYRERLVLIGFLLLSLFMVSSASGVSATTPKPTSPVHRGKPEPTSPPPGIRPDVSLSAYIVSCYWDTGDTNVLQFESDGVRSPPGDGDLRTWIFNSVGDAVKYDDFAPASSDSSQTYWFGSDSYGGTRQPYTAYNELHTPDIGYVLGNTYQCHV